MKQMFTTEIISYPLYTTGTHAYIYAQENNIADQKKKIIIKKKLYTVLYW